MEVNSPINMSSSTWILIILALAAILYFYCKRYKRETKKERFRDMGGDPCNKLAFEMWSRQQPIPPYAMTQTFPPSPYQVGPTLPPFPQDPRSSLRALQYDARPAITYDDSRFVEIHDPPRPRNRNSPTRRPSPDSSPSARMTYEMATNTTPRMPPRRLDASSAARAPSPAPPQRRQPADTPMPGHAEPPKREVKISAREARQRDWDEIKPTDL